MNYSSTYKTATEVNTAMGRVYLYMAIAVVISMIVGLGVASSPSAMAFLHTGIVKWVVIFAPLAAVFGIVPVINSDPPRIVAHLCLYAFAALMGLSMSVILSAYTSVSIASAFMGAAVLFVLMSGYGYFTKKSLDSIGKYLIIALIALIIVSIINIFIGASGLQMLLSVIAVIIFLGLTAYDTQKIRESIQGSNSESVEVLGALSLYLDFINIFINLLQLFGEKD